MLYGYILSNYHSEGQIMLIRML